MAYKVNLEVSEEIETLLKFLPLSVRKQFMDQTISAIAEQNEKKIKEALTGMVQKTINLAISKEDEEIISDLVNKAIVETGVIFTKEEQISKKRKRKVSLIKEEQEDLGETKIDTEKAKDMLPKNKTSIDREDKVQEEVKKSIKDTKTESVEKDLENISENKIERENSKERTSGIWNKDV